MEEKERYIFIDLEEGIELIDTENKTALDDADKIKDTLNQQDKRIKELEEENGYIVFTDGYDENGNEIYKQEYVTYKNRFKELLKENQQLKQQLEEMQNEKNELISKYRYWRGECCELKQQLHDLLNRTSEKI